MSKYYFVSVLKSIKDNKFYTGYTSDLKRRINGHNNGEVKSTKHRTLFDLVYFEGCKNKYDAINREKYLTIAYSKRYIKNRIKNNLND
jgi:putative endonuclease